jgi:hypothetical protein
MNRRATEIKFYLKKQKEVCNMCMVASSFSCAIHSLDPVNAYGKQWGVINS